MSENKQVLSEADIYKALKRISHEIIEKNNDVNHIVIVGIKSRGDHLARRIVQHIKDISGESPAMGALDITLYRDDLTEIADHPIVRPTELNININKKAVVLIDDVLYTGRTIRCALNQIIDYGRPSQIQLAVLVDRGHRELPIKADYVGKNIPTKETELVNVLIQEIDGKDAVEVKEAI